MIIGCQDSSDCFLTRIMDEEFADIHFYYEGGRLTGISTIQTWTTAKIPFVSRLIYGKDGKVDSVSYEYNGTEEYAVFSYDGAGRVIEVNTDFGWSSKYGYNSNGQVITQELQMPSSETLFEYFYPNTQTTNYDSMRTSELYQDSYITTFSYDSHPNPLFGMVTYYMHWFTGGDVHTENNILTRVGNGHQSFTYQYDKSGYPTKSTSNSGRVRTFTVFCQMDGRTF